MAYTSLKTVLTQQLADIRAAGLYKHERQLLSPQGTDIRVAQGSVLNLCANNYLGLANHPDIRRAAIEILNTCRDKRAVDQLIAATRGPDWWVSERAADALGDIGDARAREAVRLPRVLADEHGDLAVLEIAMVAGAEHLALHPEFAGFLLRQRVRAVLHTERLEQRIAQTANAGPGVKDEPVPTPFHLHAWGIATDARQL